MRPSSRIVASVVATGFIPFSLSQLAGAELNSSGKHCLWRIINARAPFYLLGSVHSLQRLDYEKAPVIEQAIRSGTATLVIAGALHFSSPRSVIALLQRRGYKIEQL